jgi:DedD protein
MPFFNFRRGGSNAASTAGSAAQTESVEVIRKRAKHRLIGSAVLVLIGVVGFPLLFDTQPRPIPVDIPIEIPGKGAVKPLVVPGPTSAPAATPASTPKVAEKPAEKVTADASLAPKEEILSSKPAPTVAAPAQPAIKNEAKPEAKPDVKPPVKPEAKPAKPAASDDASRAAALLNGTAAPAPTTKPSASEADGRFVVQVGAFADVAKAREARLKVEKAGLKTYTQVAETKDGKRIRVRVGPFASKAEADKAAAKIKTLDLPAAILTL